MDNDRLTELEAIEAARPLAAAERAELDALRHEARRALLREFVQLHNERVTPATGLTARLAGGRVALTLDAADHGND